MSTLEYAVWSVIPKDKVYTMIHQCKKCPYITKSWFLINNHIKGHFCRDSSVLFDCSTNNLESFICKDCNFSTLSTTTFINHIVNHKMKRHSREISAWMRNNETYPYENYESKLFIQVKFKQVKFKQSDLSGNAGRWFHCVDCSYMSKNSRNLRKHRFRMHTLPENIKWFECSHCSYKTKIKHDLQSHILHRHKPLEDIAWFYCEKCPYRCKMKNSLRRHMVSRHTSDRDVRWFHCDHCSFRNKLKDNLRRHMSRHHTMQKTSSSLNVVIVPTGLS